MDAEHDEFFTVAPTNHKEGISTMSIEQKIEANTAALVALTAALAAHTAALGGKPAAPAAPAAAGKTETAKPPAAGAALDYEKDVKPLALRVAKEKGRDKLVEILGTFKVAQANLLKPEQWNDFVTACNKALS